jgi:site-specific recombinase XerD
MLIVMQADGVGEMRILQTKLQRLFVHFLYEGGHVTCYVLGKRDGSIVSRADDNTLDDEHKDALFLSLQGKRMTERQIRELVKKYTSIALNTTRKAGYSPHKLRATAATSLIGRGNSIFDVAALLDHEQVTTTQLYARQKINVKRDLVKDMEWEEERTEK